MDKQKKENVRLTINLIDIKRIIKCNDNKELEEIINVYKRTNKYKYINVYEK